MGQAKRRKKFNVPAPQAHAAQARSSRNVNESVSSESVQTAQPLRSRSQNHWVGGLQTEKFLKKDLLAVGFISGALLLGLLGLRSLDAKNNVLQTWYNSAKQTIGL